MNNNKANHQFLAEIPWLSCNGGFVNLLCYCLDAMSGFLSNISHILWRQFDACFSSLSLGEMCWHPYYICVTFFNCNAWSVSRQWYIIMHYVVTQFFYTFHVIVLCVIIVLYTFPLCSSMNMILSHNSLYFNVVTKIPFCWIHFGRSEIHLGYTFLALCSHILKRMSKIFNVESKKPLRDMCTCQHMVSFFVIWHDDMTNWFGIQGFC